MFQLPNLLYSDVRVSRKTQIFRFSINDNQDTVVTVVLDYLVYLDVVRVEFRAGVVPAVDIFFHLRKFCYVAFHLLLRLTCLHVKLPMIFCFMQNA